MLTDDDETNAIIERNRRIGVSITGIADWMATIPRKSDIVRLLNKGYDLVKATNVQLAIEAKVPQSIRLTTVKPSGTVSLLAGVSAGMHHPLFQTYVRRMKVGNTSPIYPILVSAGVPYEADLKEQDTTTIFEFPIHQKNIRPQDQVSLAEHGLRLILLSRFWADNAVSNTSTYRQTRYDDVEGNEYSFDPDMLVKKQGQWYAKKFDNGVQSLVSIDKIAKGEEEDIEPWLTYVLPHVKSISMLGYMNGTTVYKQAPYEGITMDEFDKRSAAIGDVDWSTFEGSDGEDSRYCEGEYCAI